MNLPPHTYQFIGKQKGPCVVIMGSVHGDEKIGVHIIKLLKHILPKQKILGEIYLVFGNPKAYQNNSRYIDCDLNRLFGSKQGKGYEKQRALELKPILQKTDYLLDIHSTIKPSVPFIFCQNNKNHLKFATLFNTKYIVSPKNIYLPTDLNSCTDNYTDKYGGIGLTYETGWQQDKQENNTVLENIKIFLKTLGVAFMDKPINPNTKKTMLLSIYGSVIPQTKNFFFTKNFENFSFITKNKCLANDNKKKILVPHNSYIIFPKKQLKLNKPACYLATCQNYE